MHAVLFVALYCVGLPTVAVLSDRSRSNLILLELIVPHPDTLLINKKLF
ncbi:MAG: hypothetical protein HWQ36_24590 [Nostoc sp. NMS2]|nr:hypothetical protein [Nostoc sp. NMS2]MBN3993578.1 hypothetical protein [Nostoc sp. NMS2]